MRDVDPIVDDQRHAERVEHGLERARGLEQRAPAGVLVAQLHQGDAAPDRGGDDVGQRCGRAPARDRSRGKGSDRSAAVMRSSPPRAPSPRRAAPARRRSASAGCPGPRRPRPPARRRGRRSRAPCAAASSGSGSTVRNAPITALAAQPSAVTRVMRGSPLPTSRQRAPSVIRSSAPVTATTAPDDRASCAAGIDRLVGAVRAVDALGRPGRGAGERQDLGGVASDHGRAAARSGRARCASDRAWRRRRPGRAPTGDRAPAPAPPRAPWPRPRAATGCRC